jgi:hypothetical protein
MIEPKTKNMQTYLPNENLLQTVYLTVVMQIANYLPKGCVTDCQLFTFRLCYWIANCVPKGCVTDCQLFT